MKYVILSWTPSASNYFAGHGAQYRLWHKKFAVGTNEYVPKIVHGVAGGSGRFPTMDAKKIGKFDSIEAAVQEMNRLKVLQESELASEK